MEINKLTDKTLKKVKPQDKRYRIYVKSSPGLFLLVSTTGSISFQYRFQLNEKRREIKIGNYPAETMQSLMVKYSVMVNQVKQGIDPLREQELQQQQAEDEPLFSEFAERFIKHYVKKKLAPTTALEYERKINKILIPAWGKRKVVDIRREHIVKLVEKISDTTPVMANRTLSATKKMLNYAVNKGVIEINPAMGIEKPGDEHPRTRYLEMEEVITLFKTLDTLPDRDLRDILQLILLSAQRPGEIRKMHKKNLKRDNTGLWFELSGDQTKNSEPTRIFLNNMADAIIQKRINDLDLTGFIFPARTKTGFIRKDVLVSKVRRLQALTGKPGIEKFTAHDLRRSAATGIAKLGHGAVVDDILNHKQRSVTRRVYDLYDRSPEIKRALTAWGEAVQMALDGNAGKIIPIAQGR